jgi:hypothetical protein
MKKTMSFILLLVVAVALGSCTKESSLPVRIINHKVSLDEVYQFNLEVYGDEEGAQIKVQARNYDISQLLRDAATNWGVVYQYKPSAGFTGTDYTVIDVYRGSDGASPSRISERIKFVFTIDE